MSDAGFGIDGPSKFRALVFGVCWPVALDRGFKQPSVRSYATAKPSLQYQIGPCPKKNHCKPVPNEKIPAQSELGIAMPIYWSIPKALSMFTGRWVARVLDEFSASRRR
jgi:hypothetical protein